MAASLWDGDLEVLETVATLEGERGTDVDAIAAALEGDVQRSKQAVRRLWDDGYLDASDASDMGGFDATSIRLLGKGRRVIGQWPNEAAAFKELIDALGAQAAHEGDPERRDALERAKDGLQAAGASAVGSVLATLWRQLAGM